MSYSDFKRKNGYGDERSYTVEYEITHNILKTEIECNLLLDAANVPNRSIKKTVFSIYAQPLWIKNMTYKKSVKFRRTEQGWQKF
jgi:hypothetical protein